MTDPDTRQRRQPQQTRTDVAQRPDRRAAVMETVRQASVERKENVTYVAQMMKAQAWTFSKLLPSHMSVDTFMGTAYASLWKNDLLMRGAVADPDAFMVALRESAALGHLPGTDHYWLTPRRRALVKDGPQIDSVVGIEGYQGIIDRMYRAGGVLSVRCHTVREKDTFDPDGGLNGAPLHVRGGPRGAFSLREDRGPVIGVYAYAILNGGMPSQVVLMGLEELMEHRAKATTKSVWDAWPEAMYRKTALRQLEPYVPLSEEYRDKVAQNVATIAAVAPTQAAPGRSEVEAADDEGQDTPEGDVEQGKPVTDVPYSPQDWRPGADDPGWADLQVARPGGGVPPEVRKDA